MQKYDKCKLCGQKSKLSKSHLIPEFLHKSIYDNKHRGILYSRERNKKGKPRYIQKGFRERLLCEACEQHLSQIERQFKTEWYDQNKLPSDFSRDSWKIAGFDYASFKLLHLSILWRCSVSKASKGTGVYLGTQHERRIAQLILNKDPGGDYEYTIVGTLLIMDNSIVDGFVYPPDRRRWREFHLNVYCMVYGGCEWLICISKHNNALIKHFCLQKEGSIILVKESLYNSLAARQFRKEFN